ncbi:MAG: serine/threonine-protein kinase [Myxococcales bacterium]
MARPPDSLPPSPDPTTGPLPGSGPQLHEDGGDDSTLVRDSLIGTVLGEYRITRRLGEGGMGVVYAGIQPVIQKPVAIKILQSEVLGQADEVDRLVAEARAANAVRHRGIVDVFAFGKLPDGRPYIVMDLLQGEPLDTVIEREAPLTIDRVLSILDDVLDTLTAAHTAGVIHRDLKPANMFLVRQAHGEAYVRILDFGLAKHSAPGGGPRGQRASTVAGTPHYMAPEQALGEVVGPRADLYSVGCIAYELLTGRLPFDTEDPVEQIAKRLSTVPERAAKVARVPAKLDEIVMRLLEREPEDRPASAAIVRQQLAKYRRILQSESTVMGPRPKAPVLPDADESTARAQPAFTPTPVPVPDPVPEAARITQRTGKPPTALAVGVAAAGLVALLGVAAVLLPRAEPGAAMHIPNPPAKDEPAQERLPAQPPERLPEPKPPPPEPPAVKGPPTTQPEPQPLPKPAQPRPRAADALEVHRKAVLGTLAKVASKNKDNPAVMNTVAKIREAANAARSEVELKKAETRIEDELPMP